MIIGEWAIIPEDAVHGYCEFIPALAGYRLVLQKTDGTLLEQFTPVKKDADEYLKLINKAIEDGSEARAIMREALAKFGDYDDE